MQVVCPPPRPLNSLKSLYKHIGQCLCFWCIRDSVFWNNNHGHQCYCKWCVLDITEVRATGANAPRDLFLTSNTTSTQLNAVTQHIQEERQKPVDSNTNTLCNTQVNTSNRASLLHSQVSDTSTSIEWIINSISTSIDSFNDSSLVTIESADEVDIWCQINHLISHSDISTSEHSLNTSGSLLNASTITDWEDNSNCSLQLIKGASEKAVQPSTTGNDSHDKVSLIDIGASNNKLHNQLGFTPDTFITALVDSGHQSIDHSDMSTWVKLAHDTASKHNVPNYMGARVRVVSQLDIRQWRHLLANYEFSRVCDYVEFGFPISLDYKDFKYNTSVDNHPSASQFPEAVEDYLRTEMSYNAIVGPFRDPPFEKLHVSPMMTRPKPDGSRRIIVDMSWPHGDSVNSHIPDGIFDDMAFQLRYPTVDHIVSQISTVGPSARLYKIDLKRAYRNLRTDPRDFTVLGLYWKGKRYVDVSVPFGIKSGASACQMVTDCVTHLMASQGHWTCTYLDDVMGVSNPSTADNAFTSLKNLIQTLGLPINSDKVVAPTHEMTCLGINIGARTRTLTIPESKVQQVQRLCNQWASKAYATCRSLQKLLGHLIYLHRCVTPSRLFVNRILQVLRATPPPGPNLLRCRFLQRHQLVSPVSGFLQWSHQDSRRRQRLYTFVC